MVWLDIEEQLNTSGVFDRLEIATILEMIRAGNLIRDPGAMKTLDFSMYNIEMLKAFLKWWHSVMAGPYQLNLVNMLNIPVQYVWAYELWSGLILIDETPYTQPGGTAMIAYQTCAEMRQYAISVWDINDNELGQTPTLTVQQINQIELQNGTFKLCEDIIEIG
jgi:hypothetical protein